MREGSFLDATPDVDRTLEMYRMSSPHAPARRIDDDPEKGAFNPPHTSVAPTKWRAFAPPQGSVAELAPGGALRRYLSALATAPNTQEFISANKYSVSEWAA